MKPVFVYVLWNYKKKIWVEPEFTSMPWVSACIGFKETNVPFFTNEEAFNILIQCEPPGMQDVQLRVAKVELTMGIPAINNRINIKKWKSHSFYSI